jgi:hypothetical protein
MMNARTKAGDGVFAALLLLAFANSYSFAAERPNVTGAELKEFGVYRHYGLKFETPPHTRERHYAEMREQQLLKKGDMIAATLGTTFGITYTLTGTPPKAGVKVVIEVVHPPTVNPKTGKTSTLEKAVFQESIGAPAYCDMQLDTPESVAAGQWTFRVIYESKVLLEKSFQVAEARLLSESEAIVIDDVPVFGRVDVVSENDIHDVIKEATDNSSSEPRKPRALEVITADEMRAYRRERDLGWRPMRLGPVIEPDGREHLSWGTNSFAIQGMPEALRLIRTAEQVYVFPLPNPSKPERDDKHLRLLGPSAWRGLMRLLGYSKDWFQGGYSLLILQPPDPSVGFVFRRGNDELVLFFTDTIAEATYNGENTGGLLDHTREKQFERWKKRYAKQELSAR